MRSRLAAIQDHHLCSGTCLPSLRKKHVEAGSGEVLTFKAATNTIEIPADLPPPPCVKPRLSSMRASWFFVRREDVLDEKQRKDVEPIRQGHPDLEGAYQLGQEFGLMLLDASSQRSGHLADPG